MELSDLRNRIGESASVVTLPNRGIRPADPTYSQHFSTIDEVSSSHNVQTFLGSIYLSGKMP